MIDWRSGGALNSASYDTVSQAIIFAERFARGRGGHEIGGRCARKR